mgnify:CR=1 FL=1
MASKTAGVSSAQTTLAHLEEGEEVLGNISYGWSSYLRLIILGIITAPILIGLVILLHVYQAKRKSGCVVTNYRVVQTTGGLFSSETTEIRLEDIRSISTYDSFGSGGVKLDTGAGEISVGATNPREMANVIREQKNKRDNQ